MKYINLRISPNNDYVEVTRACSHGNCDQILKGDENYCPKCGSPLKKLPDHLDKEAIIALVNENIDKLPHSIEANDPYTQRKSVDTQLDSFDRSIAINDMDGKQKCPYGKEDPSTCGLCTGKGVCTAVVLTSFPPKYNMCPFRGSGYIDCKDAE